MGKIKITCFIVYKIKNIISELKDFILESIPVMVYVLDINGQSLMPTDRYGKVKHLLRQGKAVVVKRCRLQYGCCMTPLHIRRN